MLQYDDSAFYFFAISLLSCSLTPAWYGIISRALQAFSVNRQKHSTIHRTSAAGELKKEGATLTTLRSKSFLLLLGTTVLLSIIFVWLLIIVVSQGMEVDYFDPFSILAIDHGAKEKVIRRAYRELSKKHHPDHNPEDPTAESRFRLINKAYRALTDKEANANWKEGWDPDGKQLLEYGIALPSILMDGYYRNIVSVAYLMLLVGLVPTCVWAYYSNSQMYGEKGIMYDSYSWYNSTLTANTLLSNLPEIMAGSAEFRRRNLPESTEDKEEIKRLKALVQSQMKKPTYRHPTCIKGNMLLHAHMLRKTEHLTKQQREDLQHMLQMSNSLVDAMTSVCKQKDFMQTAINCIEFGQHMTQAMWIEDSPLLQLPHFTKEVVKKCSPVQTVQEYRALPEEQKEGMVKFSNAQKKDVMGFLDIFPDVSVETKVFVDDDEDSNIYENDLVTLQVTITCNNAIVPSKEKAGSNHAAWWVLLGQANQDKIISVEKVMNPCHKIVHFIRFIAPPKGLYSFDLIVKSDTYVGCDFQEKVEIQSLDNAALPEYQVHPEDAELDKEPTLWEEMLNANIEEDSDEDSKGDHAAAQSAKDKRKAKLQKARVQQDEGGDSKCGSDEE